MVGSPVFLSVKFRRSDSHWVGLTRMYFRIRSNFIANYEFPIIALPQFAGERCPTRLFHTIGISFGGHGFEPMNHIPATEWTDDD